jgi:hypothetical protein
MFLAPAICVGFDTTILILFVVSIALCFRVPEATNQCFNFTVYIYIHMVVLYGTASSMGKAAREKETYTLSRQHVRMVYGQWRTCACRPP